MKFKTMWTKQPTSGRKYDVVDKVDRVNCADPRARLRQVIETGEAFALASLSQLPYDVDDLAALDDLDYKNLSTLALVRKLSADFSNRHLCKKITEDALSESIKERFARKVKEQKSAAERLKAEQNEILKRAADIAASQIKSEDEGA